MSRGNSPAFPGYRSHPTMLGAPDVPTRGLTVREFTALQIFALAVCAPAPTSRPLPIHAGEYAREAFALADEFVAELDRQGDK